MGITGGSSRILSGDVSYVLTEVLREEPLLPVDPEAAGYRINAISHEGILSTSVVSLKLLSLVGSDERDHPPKKAIVGGHDTHL